MAEIVAPGVLKTPKARRKFKVTDIIIFLVLAAVIIALLVTLVGKLRLKHEVANAKATTDRLITDIAKQNATDAHNLGDTSFRAKNSTAQLKSLFEASQKVIAGTPAVEREIVSNTAKADNVYIIYKYGGKSPYYIRVAVSKASGSSMWKLTGITGNNAEAPLIVK